MQVVIHFLCTVCVQQAEVCLGQVDCLGAENQHGAVHPYACHRSLQVL